MLSEARSMQSSFAKSSMFICDVIRGMTIWLLVN